MCAIIVERKGAAKASPGGRLQPSGQHIVICTASQVNAEDIFFKVKRALSQSCWANWTGGDGIKGKGALSAITGVDDSGIGAGAPCCVHLYILEQPVVQAEAQYIGRISTIDRRTIRIAHDHRRKSTTITCL